MEVVGVHVKVHSVLDSWEWLEVLKWNEILALEFPSLFLRISSTPVEWHFKSFPSKYKLFTFNPCTLPKNSEI